MMSRQNMIFRVAYDQYLGGRARQEDSIATPVYIEGKGVLIVLADGMGGHGDGHLASKTVTDAFVAAAKSGKSLLESLNAANDVLATRKMNNQIAEDAGCTLVAVLANETSFSYISVGDSYILHKHRDKGMESFKKVNDLHTLGWKLFFCKP